MDLDNFILFVKELKVQIDDFQLKVNESSNKCVNNKNRLDMSDTFLTFLETNSFHLDRNPKLYDNVLSIYCVIVSENKIPDYITGFINFMNQLEIKIKTLENNKKIQIAINLINFLEESILLFLIDNPQLCENILMLFNKLYKESNNDIRDLLDFLSTHNYSNFIEMPVSIDVESIKETDTIIKIKKMKKSKKSEKFERLEILEQELKKLEKLEKNKKTNRILIF